MNTNSSSITFYCPNHLKTSFDDLVKFKRISRTSIINTLMEQWLRSEHQQLKEDDKLQSLLNDVKLRSHKNKSFRTQPSSKRPTPSTDGYFDDDDKPMIPLKSDYHNDDWSDVSGLGRLGELK